MHEILGTQGSSLKCFDHTIFLKEITTNSTSLVMSLSTTLFDHMLYIWYNGSLFIVVFLHYVLRLYNSDQYSVSKEWKECCNQQEESVYFCFMSSEGICTASEKLGFTVWLSRDDWWI